MEPVDRDEMEPDKHSSICSDLVLNVDDISEDKYGPHCLRTYTFEKKRRSDRKLTKVYIITYPMCIYVYYLCDLFSNK